MPMYGIDISKYQARIDLLAVPCDFVIVYVGPLNPYWEDQVKAAMRAGKRVLLYHYAHDGGVKRTASSEADQFLSLTRPYWALVDGTALDWESKWQDDVPWSLEWLKTVRSESEKTGWFYAYYHTLSDYDFGPVFREGFPLWEAAYVLDRPNAPTRIDGHNPPDVSLRWPVKHWGSPLMWQYTSTGYLPGWGERLDLNVFHGDRAAWDRIHAPKEAAMGYTWMTDRPYTVTQEFGANPNNGVNPAGGHTGRDFACPEGTPLYAPGAGRIVWAGPVDETWEDNFLWLVGGRAIALDCGDAEPTFVAGHVRSEAVAVGDWVQKGQLLGESGNTGHSEGPHLHLETLLPGYVLDSPTLGRSDPRTVCSGYATPLTPAGGDVTPIPPEEDMALTDADIDRITHAILIKPAYDGGPQVSQVLKDLEEQNMFREGEDKVRPAGLGYIAAEEIKGSLASITSRLNGIAEMVGRIPTTAPGGADIDLDALADKFVQRVTPTVARAFLAAVRNALPEEG